MSSSTLVPTPPRTTRPGTRTSSRPARLSAPSVSRSSRAVSDCPPNCDYCCGPETD